jgi:hypothetical protein
LLRDDSKQPSLLHSILYSKIPENHILKKIDSAINWSFLRSYLLESSCCKHYGRTVHEQEVMLRILFLKHLFKLSDEKVMEELGMRMDYKWFIGLNPEDPLPETSLLTKFRTQRLKGTTMDAIIAEILRQCAEKGIIKKQ